MSALMKAAFVRQPGPAESMEIGSLAIPELAAGSVLVQVKASAVNPIDTYVRGGNVKMEIPLPYIPGCDLAGVVQKVGSAVTQFRPGDRVWGSNQSLFGRQGTLAEFAAVDAGWLYPIPQGVTEVDAAAMALVGITAQLGLERLALKPGEVLFINGGTGGVGSSVVQMAKAQGAKVITTAGSPQKVALCQQLGADLAINYKTTDVDTAIREYAPGGVNAWWETLREVDLDRVVSLLAKRGRIVVMAGREARPVFPLGPFYVKDCSMFGFAMFNASQDEQRACAAEINRLMASGQLKARVDRTLPLEQAGAAHRLQEDNTLNKQGTLAGKIVVCP